MIMKRSYYGNNFYNKEEKDIFLEQLNMNLNIYLEDSIHSMDHSVGCEDVKEDNISLASGGLDLDELVPGHADLLAAGGL